MLLADTKTKVVQILNASGLPIDAIYYVMREVMYEVENAYQRALEEEQRQKAEAERPTTAEEAEALNKKYEEENR